MILDGRTAWRNGLAMDDARLGARFFVQRFEHPVQIRYVAQHQPRHEAILAGDDATIHDLGHGLKSLFDRTHLAGQRLHPQNSLKLETQCSWIQAYGEAFYHARIFHSKNALTHRRRGEADLSADHPQANPRIIEKQVKYRPVGVVKRARIHVRHLRKGILRIQVPTTFSLTNGWDELQPDG